MSDDMLIHFSSNSSNQSDQSLPTKMAKLEARLVGKAPSAAPAASQQPQQQQPTWQSLPLGAKFGPAEELAGSSDSDEDNQGEFLIQANTQKRQRLQEDGDSSVSAHLAFSFANHFIHMKNQTTDGRQKVGENLEMKATVEVQKRKQGRSRGNSVSSRARGSRVADQTKSQVPASTVIPSVINGQLENCQKDQRPKEHFLNNDHSLLQEEITSLRATVAALEEELHKSRQHANDSQNLCHQLEKELKELKDSEQQMKPKRLKIISDLLISVSKAERQEARMKVRQDSLRLGNVGVIRTGTIISETWEDGQMLKDLNAHMKQLLETKEAVDRQRKSLKKRQSDKGEAADAESGTHEEDLLIQDEILKSRLASIKRAFDLVEHRYVACKLHGLNAQWSEDKKQSYVRHAIREYNIHKTLVHNHIVRLWDIFEIDQNTFCTVLEYCSGKDLDAVLKATPTLPEKEARIIIVQIFQGLLYLNKRAQKIIHYDLKPGNVLFDEFGAAKVTDFGLSKIVEDNVGSQGMELTSQGAGTYWYLPPECFELNKTPLISSKVDVWSAGVLLYQMLFGRRPFGHDQSQERILREDTIIKARRVEFPNKPTVSNEVKEFIRRCLTYDQTDRPDVLSAAQDPYLTYLKK
ncbi:unnamed protein product [Linum tenue]|uniref:Protein kinase domain-containing protein n=1 Tax=Linum tenue TaxID=586396 RepID=A0AAV0Q8P3_9ROSI|nr:unnamed protein product [Linum tenue]